jgi:hypothetical protein
MPTSFAMAVLADFGWARIDVMKPSDNMTDCSQKFELVIGSAPEILFRDRLFERIRFVKFHGGVASKGEGDAVARVFFLQKKYDWSETAGDLWKEERLGNGRSCFGCGGGGCVAVDVYLACLLGEEKKIYFPMICSAWRRAIAALLLR